MKAKNFVVLMTFLVALLIISLFLGKCNNPTPIPDSETTLDSIVSYYQPAMNILRKQRYYDSLVKNQSIQKTDSLAVVVASLKNQLSKQRKLLLNAEDKKDTPAIVYQQRKVINEQDSVIYQQDQQLSEQSITIQSQDRIIKNYATELELQKGIIN
jgi:hypothetical protein